MNKSSVSYLVHTALVFCLLLAAGCGDQLVGPEGVGSTASLARAASGTPDASKAADGRVKLEVRLSATNADPRASGKAKFEQRTDRIRFSTQVEDVSTDGASTVQVSRNGTPLFSASISIALGLGDLNLDARDGDHVPTLAAGDRVEVFNPNGVLILSGAF